MFWILCVHHGELALFIRVTLGNHFYPIHLFGEISRRGEISLKMTNIALVRALRI